jgi:flagellum-specific peptidoglycan hydrolase FlgJ
LTHNEVLKRAYQVQKETGLSTATVLAQKGLESRWGQSKFCSRTKNLSNIKCFNKECRKANIGGLHKRGDVGSETAHCIQLYDDGPNDRYVKLDYFWQGWTKYRTLIKKRYQRAANAESVRSEADYLRKCGFATDKHYADKIYNLATDNGLIKLQNAIDNGCTITTQTGKYILLKPN